MVGEVAAEAQREVIISRLSSSIAVGAVQAVLARAATWRLKPTRSAAAIKRRRERAASRKRKRAQSGGEKAASSAGGRPSDGERAGLPGSSGPSDSETARERVLLHDLLATRLALKDRTAVLALTRKQLRRETRTAKARWQQLARQGSKAQKKLSRSLFAKQARAVAGAARREHERSRKRKQPEGETLHSGERKHQRLVGKGGGAGAPYGGRAGGSGFSRGGAGKGGGGDGKGDSSKGGAGRGGAGRGRGKGSGGKGWGGKGGGSKGKGGKGRYGEH